MSSNHNQLLPRSFSNIDDGLNLLLADLKQEEGGPQGREGGMPGLSLTPFLKMGSLDAEQAGNRLVTTPAAAASLNIGPLLATASSYTVLKGAGSAATPLVLPNTFVPVPSGHPNRALGGKLRPGSSAPPLLLHQGSGFAIPAYGRPFTQLDFISTEDMEGGGSPASGGGAGLLYRGGSLLSATATGLADFAEFADESRLGELPSEEDLRLLLFDPAALPAMPGHSQLAARAAMLPRQHQQQQQHQPQHQQQPPSLRHSASFCGGSVQDEEGVEVVLVPAGGQGAAPWSYASPPPTVLRIRTGAGAPGGLRAAAAQVGDGGSARGSPKRRADRMDLDGRDADSMRDSKRHSSSAWSDESDGGGDTPSSAAAAVMPHPSWFGVPDHPQQQQQEGQQGQLAQPTQQQARASSLQPTRFARESGRRQGGRSSGEGAADPAYLPSRERSRALSRQQQQQQQASEQREEDEVVVVQQFRGVSRHRLTQRWEASLWLNGRQLYLGGFNSQEDAAHAYDLAALACKGLDAQINFFPDDYAQQLLEIAGYTRDEVVAYVRRRSSAFSRGKSRFRGVSGHNGRWEARIGSFNGRKNVSFGVFETEEGAARQYDRALILEKGRTAKTNFPIRDYDAEATEYETHLMRTCGATTGPAAQREALTVTLPADREATADEKKRAAVIYADALMRALRQPTQRGGRT